MFGDDEDFVEEVEDVFAFDGFDRVLAGRVDLVQGFDAGAEFAGDVAAGGLWQRDQGTEQIADWFFEGVDGCRGNVSTPTREEVFSLLDDLSILPARTNR